MNELPSTIGRYRVLQRIGLGGMGLLLLGEDATIGRKVVIKRLVTHGESEEFRQRFAREARAAGKLNHPNIVSIFDVGEQDGYSFIVMEYVEGRTLAQLLASGEELSIHERLDIAEQICAGLAHAHDEGIIHRDIKPSNVMVTSERRVKILDFGIAAMAGAAEANVTQAGAIFGTPAYMSPEMAKGQPVDLRADIYAVGVVLYELFSGKKMFEGGMTEILLRIVQGTHVPLSEAAPGVPKQFSDIVERAVALNPADRYENLHQMQSELLATHFVIGVGHPIVGLPRARFKPRPRQVEVDAPAESAASPVPLARPAPPEAPAPPAPSVPPVPTASAESAPPTPPAAAVEAAPPVPLPEPPADATVLISRPEPAAEEARVENPDATIVLQPRGTAPGPPPSGTAARLILGRCPDPRQLGRTIEIGAGPITIGRADSCDIPINDVQLSRQHVRLSGSNGMYVVEDLGSSNGTFVNGRRIHPDRPEPIFFGATIGIGATAMTFVYGQDTSMPDLTGCDVAGRYRLERLLRESPKSVVYAASDRHVPREVAIKLLSPELARYPGYREWFHREARMAAALQHPHVCPVLDSGTVQLRAPDGRQLDTLFLCLALMTGGSLADRMTRNEPVSMAMLREWLESLGGALQCAHDQNVVHGDLKPAALVFDGSGRLYLSDFASAQQADGQGGVPVMGTPAFMAPEQWNGQAPTALSDQYAMAVVAYSLIAGARPFEGQDNPEIRERNFRTGAPPAHEEAARNGREGVPRAVSDVLKRALHVEPEKRFPSVKAFTEGLLSALSKGRVAGAQPFVFFSYDRELSGGWARFFADRLSDRHGVKVFMDTVGLDKAGRFPKQLRQAIEDCDLFVCFMAGQGVSSKWVAEEIRLAHEFGKTMIPIIQESFVEPDIDDEESPIRVLLSHQGIRLFDVSGYYVEHAVADLARMILDAVASPGP